MSFSSSADLESPGRLLLSLGSELDPELDPVFVGMRELSKPIELRNSSALTLVLVFALVLELDEMGKEDVFVNEVELEVEFVAAEESKD